MLDIETFDNLRGGNVVYKALAHPLAAEGLTRLAAMADGRVAIYDPDGIAGPLLALCTGLDVEGVYVHDSLAVGQLRGGHVARAVTALLAAPVAFVLVAGFDAARVAARIGPFLPAGARVLTLDEAKLPPELLTHEARYLEAVNFATNFVFFRDDGRLATRLTTVNYWSGYGAKAVRLWLRLYDGAGAVLAEWQQEVPASGSGVVIDSQEVRARFKLPGFAGQLFIHAIGVAGHDVVKYALDTYASDNGASLSCTHDANAWPAARFAGLPAPRLDERVVLWLQNSHAVAIPAGAIRLGRMGAAATVAVDEDIPAFASHALDVGGMLPDVAWPAQIEIHAGRHLVRPRYEVTRGERTRIAHVNVERDDLRPDPGIETLDTALGRGFLLPFPVLPRRAFRTIVLPTPMAESETATPLRLDVFAPDGALVAQRYLGVLPRQHEIAVDLDDVLAADDLPGGGHAELVYDFQGGGTANGWLHALFRYESRDSGHVAESSFGAHIFNTIMTYKAEPQSYSGPPPGLSTRLFLKLGYGARVSFCVLMYPASAPWRGTSDTALELYDARGLLLAMHKIQIACCGSVLIYPHRFFSPALLQAADGGGYLLIRDATCRLFGFHGVDDLAGGFSFDHMFGF